MTRARTESGKLLPAALLALAAAAAPPAGARELHWTALVVDATLESDGTLAIAERQDMVFTGDWNGGERSFRLFPGQRLTVDRIVRIDAATGAERELERGDLDQVDRWDWAGSSAVRWRSRLPSDPEFDATPISYRLEYRLTGALVSLGGRAFRLDHDWAFADREGVIERVEVGLRLADGWRAPAGFPGRWATESLAPGQGYVVPLDLEYDGAELPAARVPPVPPPPAVRFGAVALFLGGALYFLICLVWRERALGRLGGAAAPPIDAAWLEQNLFTMAPEVVGAAWDRAVGSSEVAAVLARLTGEGKLAARVESKQLWIFRNDNLHLQLLADRGALSDYERALVDALFGASDTTDTQSVRKRYRSTGFDPASKIRTGIEARLKRSRGFEAGSPKPDWRPTGLLVAAGALLLVAAAVLHRDAPAWAFFAPLLVTLPPWLLLGLVPALAGQGNVRFPRVALVLQLAGMALLAAGLGFVGGRPGVSMLHVGGALLLALGLARSAFNLIATRESPESLARRRELARARDYFDRELRQAAPRLEDRWYPYLLAFGLAPQVDRWFRSYGDATRTGGIGSSTTGSGGSFSGGSGGGWTGGGGAFGGAGASASFAAAATAMGAGVSAPSSSGSGGGGGGSSGGGGGGGW